MEEQPDTDQTFKVPGSEHLKGMVKAPPEASQLRCSAAQSQACATRAEGSLLTGSAQRTSPGQRMGLSVIMPLQRQHVAKEDKSGTWAQTASILQ